MKSLLILIALATPGAAQGIPSITCPAGTTYHQVTNVMATANLGKLTCNSKTGNCIRNTMVLAKPPVFPACLTPAQEQSAGLP